MLRGLCSLYIPYREYIVNVGSQYLLSAWHVPSMGIEARGTDKIPALMELTV